MALCEDVSRGSPAVMEDEGRRTKVERRNRGEGRTAANDARQGVATFLPVYWSFSSKGIRPGCAFVRIGEMDRLETALCEV